MANKLGEAPVVHEWSAEEKESMVQSYSCHLVAERATPEQIKDKTLPTDTLQVKYIDSIIKPTPTCVEERE